jgi:catechol 2,3-dioxygenase-like lactoylglutathione lyase family enzyme
MDAAIAWYRAVLGFDLIDGPVQARVRPPRLIHRRRSWVTGLLGGVIGGGQEPTGRGFIGGGNQHANTL